MADDTTIAGLDSIKQGIAQLKKGLESTVYAAAGEVRALRTTCSEEYANAILWKNRFGGDVAEIYFFHFAPAGFPSPNDLYEYGALINDPVRSREYATSCFNGWKEELQKVEKIVQRYEGIIVVEKLLFQDYLKEVEKTKEVPHRRVHVALSLPGQKELRLVNAIEQDLGRYNARTSSAAAVHAELLSHSD